MNKNKRILIITDSMAMPRENLPYEHTWIYLIKKDFPEYDFIDRPESGSTTLRLVTEGGGGVSLLERYKPDIVIIQMGLAECAPRLFKKKGFEHFIMTRIFSNRIREKYIKYTKRRRIRRPELTYIPPEQFKKNIEQYFTRAQSMGTCVIIILIPKPTSLLVSKSPYVKGNIDLYNAIYRETAARFANVHYVHPFHESVDVDSFALDEMHVNLEGAKIITESLKPLIIQLSI